MPPVPPSRLGAAVRNEVGPFPLVDLDLVGSVPFAAAVALVCEQADLAFAAVPAAERVVEARFVQVPADEVLRELAAAVGLAVELNGSTVRFISPDQSVSSVALLAPGVTDAETLREVIQAAVPGAEAYASEGRVAVVGSIPALAQSNSIGEALQGGRDGWLLEFELVLATSSLSRSVGIRPSVSGVAEFSASAVSGPGGPALSTAAAADLAARAVLSATEESTEARSLTRGTLYVLEGGSGSFQQGQTVPVPQRSVSPEGTTTVSGFSFVETGFIVSVDSVRLPDGRLLVDVAPQLSSVSGFVEDAPLVNTSEVQSQVLLEENRWVVISGLDAAAEGLSASGLPFLSRTFVGGDTTRTYDDSELLVLMRGRRVASSYVGP